MNLFDIIGDFGEVQPCEKVKSPMDESLAESLLRRLDPKYRSAFEKLNQSEQIRTAFYFLPHSSQKEILSVTRPRMIKWYCPFADQREFPSGVRFSINVYTGCEHGCKYCYVHGYSAKSSNDTIAKCKEKFRHLFLKDLEELENWNVPCSPVHLSNSTDAFGPIESQWNHSLFVLEKLNEFRHRFSTVTLLTKNPGCLLRSPYLELLKSINYPSSTHPKYEIFHAHSCSPLWVEISLAFWNDKVREIFEPGTPSVQERLDAIALLKQAGISVALRIDPLFPHNPLPGGKNIADFDLDEMQSQHDLEKLISFCQEQSIGRIIYSPLKITLPRSGELSEIMCKIKLVYESLAFPNRLEFHGGSWRLSHEQSQKFIITPFLDQCHQTGIEVKSCKENLLTTP